MIDTNPAYRPWNGPHGSPAFAEAKAEHFPEAFEAAFAERRKEIEALANDPAKPTFDNTFLALERLGRDPAVSSPIIVTFTTDFVGFFALLAIAALVLM